MKMKRDKKLALSAETLRRLTDVAMVEVAGGFTSQCTICPRACTTSNICSESCSC